MQKLELEEAMKVKLNNGKVYSICEIWGDGNYEGERLTEDEDIEFITFSKKDIIKVLGYCYGDETE